MTTKRFWKIGSASFTIVFVLVLVASAVQAQTPWTASITAKSSDPRLPTPITVEFGVNPNSTNEIDAGLDTVAAMPPPPFGDLPYLNIAFAGPGLTYFSKDIRPSFPWKLIVKSGQGFTLEWKNISADVSLTLNPGGGISPIDMRKVSSNAFPAGSYSMVITVPAKITTVKPSTGGKDTEITVEGIEFGVNEQVTIDFGKAKAMATATADANGSFSKTFPITVAQPNGAVTIKATGTSGQQAEDSTFIYSGPRITSVNVTSPVKAGETITVTLKAETGGVAKFSIGGVISDLPMVEDPAGVYTGTYVAAEDITVVDAIVTVVLTDSAGNSLTDSTQKVTIRSSVDFTVSLNKGTNMMSVPLDTTAVLVGDETIETPIKKASDLATVLGGKDDVSLIISYNIETQKFQSFIPGSTPDTAPTNVDIGPSTGLIVSMKNPKWITFRGNGWQPGAVELNQGINLISIPLNDPKLKRVSDLATVLGKDKVLLIISYNAAQGKFQSFTPTTPAGTPTDVPIEGGKSLIVSMKSIGSFNVAGDAWENPSPPPVPAPLMFSLTGSPVLELDGIVTREDTGKVINDLSVTVRHLSTGVSMTDTTSDGIFSITFVYLGDQLAHVGDILEISAYNSTGSFRLDPIRHVLTEADIELSRISLGNLVASVIPNRSELLANFPNPFNPETWIPFKLKEASDTLITIYDVHGRVVRKLDLGYIPAGIYQTKAKSAYWDGTNDLGERVASGIYVYHLEAGKFSASRKMVILK
ncbi:T9SS type A sorting domain-containing protein [Candidatus Poribacteria bacterium]|nr:T9SS type A sorting domain-containing protein [Candidatus Poribacteria bacterium]